MDGRRGTPARGPVGMPPDGPVGIDVAGPDGIDGDSDGIGAGAGRLASATPLGGTSTAGRFGGAEPHAEVSGRVMRSLPNAPLPPRIL